MRIPLLGAILKSVLDAAGFRIENVGSPVNPNDAVTKEYLEEHGGSPADYAAVRENASTGAAHAAVTSGNPHGVSWDNLAGNKPTIPEGATVLAVGGGKIYKGGVEMTSYSALLALVQAGGVTLMGTVGADKDALYYPLFCDTNAIRFDATGTLGGDVKTKSYTVQPVNGDSIHVTEGSLVDLAKKSDVPTVVAPSSDEASKGKAADAYATGKRLNGKVDSYGSNGTTVAIIPGDDEWLLSYLDGRIILGEISIPKGNSVRTIVALKEQLSGITSQDVIDFLHYKGESSEKADDGQKQGDVWYVDADPNYIPKGYYRCLNDMSPYFGDIISWEFIYAKNDGKTGLERLIALYEKYKAGLFADTAFSAAMTPTASPDSLAGTVRDLKTAVSGVETLLAAI